MAKVTIEHQRETPCWKSNPMVNVAEMATKPQPLQKHLLGGCKVDMPCWMATSI